MIGCYPGSFDPPTIAHLAVAEAAVAALGLERLDLVLSVDPLGKPGATPVADRVGLLAACTAHLDRVSCATTTARLLVDVAAGYDVLVIGADKWQQVLDPAWYGSVAARDEALARLPRVVVAPRAGSPSPTGVEVLAVPAWAAEVSATAVREGRAAWAARPRDAR